MRAQERPLRGIHANGNGCGNEYFGASANGAATGNPDTHSDYGTANGGPDSHTDSAAYGNCVADGSANGSPFANADGGSDSDAHGNPVANAIGDPNANSDPDSGFGPGLRTELGSRRIHLPGSGPSG